VATAKSAHDLAKRYNVEMPITTEIYRVLYENKDPKIALKELMTRTAKPEHS
jgi:glycerol-3-phosphate dehydrogenase (NAD(P)+)